MYLMHPVTDFKIITNDLLIDATSIYNKSGSEDITYNPENTKKKVTKISMLCSTTGFIIDVKKFKTNDIKKDKKDNKKDFVTLIHDVKMIDEHLKSNNLLKIQKANIFI